MPFTKFPPEQLATLKAEFDQLPTIEAKFNFWPTKLNYEYSEVGVKLPLDSVKDFLISPQTPEEAETLNLLIIEEVKYITGRFAKLTREKVFEFEKEKEVLDTKLKGALNPLPILKKEIDWVQAEVTKYEAPVSIDGNSFLNKDWIWKSQTDSFWLNGYEEYNIRGIAPDLTNNHYSAPCLLARNNGFEVAQYREYVEKKIWEVSQKRTSTAQEETPVKRQLLLLYYTGYIRQLEESVKSDKERNKLLALLLNRSEQNVKKIVTYINHPANLFDIKTKENLLFVLERLEKAGLTKEAEKVKIELNTLKQEK
jgi:hypothetical protein